METAEQGLEESLDRGGVNEPQGDARSVSPREPLSPLGKGVKLGGKIGRESAFQLLLVHLPSQPGDLPGHFTVLSVLVVGRDVGDNFNANRSIQEISGHILPSLSPVDSVGRHPIPCEPQAQDL